MSIRAMCCTLIAASAAVAAVAYVRRCTHETLVAFSAGPVTVNVSPTTEPAEIVKIIEQELRKQIRANQGAAAALRFSLGGTA